MDTSKLTKKISSMVLSAMLDAEKAHNLLLNEPTSARKEIAAIGFINKAIAQMYSAESFYLVNIEEIESNKFEQILHQFNVYCREILKSYADNHSYQWVSIEYEKLKELYDSSPFASKTK